MINRFGVVLVCLLWASPCHAAITEAALTSACSGTDATEYTTASITPTANRLIIVNVEGSDGSLGEVPTLSGNSLTYAQIATVNFRCEGGDNRCSQTKFRAMGASPTSEAITITFAGTTGAVSVLAIGE